MAAIGIGDGYEFVEESELPKSLAVDEFARDLEGYVDRVAYHGESIVLTQGNEPVTERRPAKVGAGRSDHVAAPASLPRLTPGQRDRFAEDVDEAHAELDRVGVRDPA